MIPVKLTLKNFMSYGDDPTTLPFEGMHVACLSGDNGNGKSALLDAMTWALWGKTRASSVKSVTEDDLIRVGAEDMEVRFEFELDENLYRVVKKRKRGKSSGSDWQLAQADANGGWIPIGGGSQRETAKQIVQLLSMEHETFLNSAYLQQGHADEFTRQTPDNRKRILAEVLNLERFDRLEAKAKEKFRELKEASLELNREIQMLDSEVARLPEYEEKIAEVRASLATVEVEASNLEKQHNDLKEKLHRLQAFAEQAEQAEDRCRNIEADISSAQRDLKDRCLKLEGMQDIIAQKSAIVQDYRSYVEAEKKRDTLEPQIRDFDNADKELRTVKGEIEKEKTRLEGDQRVWQSRLATLETNVTQFTKLELQIKELSSSLGEETVLEQEWQTAVGEQDTLREAFTELKASNAQVAADIDEIDEVLEMLARPHATCPVCASDLSGQKHAQVLSRQEQKKAKMLADQEELKQKGRRLRQNLTTAEERVKTLQTRREEQARKRTQCQELIRQRDALKDVKKERDKTANELQTITIQLEKGDYAAPKRIQKQRLEQEIARLQQVKVDYEVVRQRVLQLKHIQERYQQLLSAECDWDKERQAKEQQEQRLADKQKEYKAERENWDKLKAQIAGFNELQQQVIRAHERLRLTLEEVTRLRRDETQTQTYIDRCLKSQADRKERETRRRKLNDEGRVYQALVAAFGKSGIQTYIIENAIPELENEANELLARMTDNGMSMRFETTRTAKSTKSEIETLDIKILDDAGSRPYELFSGGEAFRINFAIRIALSRVLARRSGAKLQTLILDEGFGSQDGKGRERLVEVIEAIKEDFARILVITHFEELKDAFPQRIEVIKEASGSRIHLI